MNKKITIYEYYAHNCPAESFDLINEEGDYRRPRSPKELERYIKDYVNRNGEEGLLELAKIHPDTQLVQSVCSCKKNKPVVEEKKENFSNANGNVSQSQMEQINLSRVMIYGGFVLVGIALIMRK